MGNATEQLQVHGPIFVILCMLQELSHQKSEFQIQAVGCTKQFHLLRSMFLPNSSKKTYLTCKIHKDYKKNMSFFLILASQKIWTKSEINQSSLLKHRLVMIDDELQKTVFACLVLVCVGRRILEYLSYYAKINGNSTRIQKVILSHWLGLIIHMVTVW